tara:strand:+ start:7522 stop:7725 length:204 start_codon:yes stop_codon:yes gene_type:complete
MIKIIITTLILLILIPAIGATAQTLLPEKEYVNSFFNEPLLICLIWDLVILVLCGGYKIIEYVREDY